VNAPTERSVTDDRRSSQRLPASLPGQIETAEGKQGIAITRDVSAGGFLLYSRRTLAIGDHVKLTVVLREIEHHLTGKVVRQDQLAPGESTIWRMTVAIAVDDPDEMKQLVSALG
jgi:PilZ domain